MLLLSLDSELGDLLSLDGLEEGVKGLLVGGNSGGLEEGLDIGLGYSVKELTYWGRCCRTGRAGSRQLGVSFYQITRIFK